MSAATSGRTECAIHTEGLTRRFRSIRAIENLSLQVAAGTVFGFLGPNGAGKTTTIRLLLGLLEPSSGRATVLGFDTRREAREVRKRTGVLLEHPGLIERLSAEDNLEFYGRVWHLPAPVRRARIRELLTGLGLWERRSERVGTWSRGTRQKLAIARALLHRPSLVFLDEPTAGLDPVAASALREQLALLAERERTTVFLTTHNLSEAEKLCDRIGVVREGRLLAVGSPAELRERSRLWRFRLQGRGLTDNVLELLRARREVVEGHREGDALVVELQDDGRMAPLVRFLVRMGVELEQVVRVGNSLEEVFLALVSRPANDRGYEPAAESTERGGGACVPMGRTARALSSG